MKEDRIVACPHCGGEGVIGPSPFDLDTGAVLNKVCAHCDGLGEVFTNYEDPPDWLEDILENQYEIPDSD